VARELAQRLVAATITAVRCGSCPTTIAACGRRASLAKSLAKSLGVPAHVGHPRVPGPLEEEGEEARQDPDAVQGVVEVVGLGGLHHEAKLTHGLRRNTQGEHK
jgi:hypothetical protein